MKNHLTTKRLYWILQISGWYLISIIGIISTYNWLGEWQWSIAFLHVSSSTLCILITHHSRTWLGSNKRLNGNVYQIAKTILIFVPIATAFELFFIYCLLVIITHDIWVLTPAEFFSTIISSFVFFLLWVSLYTLYKLFLRYRHSEAEKWKLEAELLETELDLLKSQINPHFIFNALNNIRSLISENPENARNAVTSLSKLLRVSFKLENNLTIPLQEELSIVKEYIKLQQIHLDHRLDVRWLGNDLKNQYRIPSLGIQTLVENAIKHGARDTNGCYFLQIKLIENHQSLHVSISNYGSLNGTYNSSNGIGLSNLKRRLEHFDKVARFQLHQVFDNLVEAKLIIYPDESLYSR